MLKYCFGNGRIREAKQTMVPVNDLAVLRGYAVFDFLKTVNGKPFLWLEHWQRFQGSAKTLGLKIPVSRTEAEKLIANLIKKNRVKDCSIRLLLTGGASGDGFGAAKPNFYILIEALHQFPKKVFINGAKVITQEYLRLVPEAKTTNYLNALRLAKEKRRRRAIEILYLANGLVLECATSNFFIVKDGTLITAKEQVLGGTIRDLVIRLAKKAGITVEEREVRAGELKTADEAFLTATSKDITPIVQIDEQQVGSGRPGPLTRQLMALLKDFMKGY